MSDDRLTTHSPAVIQETSEALVKLSLARELIRGVLGTSVLTFEDRKDLRECYEALRSPEKNLTDALHVMTY